MLRRSFLLRQLPDTSADHVTKDRRLTFPHSNPLIEQFGSESPALNALDHTAQPAQINPYAQDTNGFGASPYFQGATSYSQPVGPGLLRLRLLH